MNRRVEFRFVADASGHQASRVERDDDRLVAFDLILARDELRAPRGRRPRNMPELVAAHVIAHRFELAPFAAPHGFALNRQKALRSQCFELHFARAPHIRINLDGLRLAQISLTPDQTELGKKPDGSATEFIIPAPRRREPHDRAQGRGLADTVAAEHRRNAAGRHFEVHALQDVTLTVIGMQVLDAQHHCAPPR